jgi:hypothetical protein
MRCLNAGDARTDSVIAAAGRSRAQRAQPPPAERGRSAGQMAVDGIRRGEGETEGPAGYRAAAWPRVALWFRAGEQRFPGCRRSRVRRAAPACKSRRAHSFGQRVRLAQQSRQSLPGRARACCSPAPPSRTGPGRPPNRKRAGAGTGAEARRGEPSWNEHYLLAGPPASVGTTLPGTMFGGSAWFSSDRCSADTARMWSRPRSPPGRPPPGRPGRRRRRWVGVALPGRYNGQGLS